jgi:hypothetical protein
LFQSIFAFDVSKKQDYFAGNTWKKASNVTVNAVIKAV